MHKEQKRLPFRRLYNALLSLALMAAATLIGLLFRAVGFPETNIVIVYLLAVLLCLCMLAPLSAQAEVELLPQLTQWRLEESQAPIRATVSMELGAWLPFDETTLAALNLLLSHVSFQVETLHMAQEDWSRAAVLLDGPSARRTASNG